MRHHRSIYVASSLFALMAGLAQANAQEATAQRGSEALEEITVTAQRRTESIQDTPLAITAVTAESLDRAGVTSMASLQAAVPGLSVAQGGSSTEIYLRGVGNFATNQFAESAIAVNLDGAYLARPTGLNGMFYDLERLEVLKGPQGTLYGRNASGGALNIITKKPSLDSYNGFAAIEAGNYNLIKGTAALNVPVNDMIAVRAAGQVISRTGYLTDGYDDDSEQDGRIQALIKPSDDASLTIGLDFSHLGGKGPGSVEVKSDGSFVDPSNPWLGPSTAAANAYFLGQAAFGPPQNPVGGNGHQDIRNIGLTAQFDYDLGFAKLTILPAFRFLHDDYLTYVPEFMDDVHDNTDTKSVEARLASPDGSAIKWVGGVYYFDESSVSYQTVDQGFNLDKQKLPKLDTTSYAAFGEATYPVTDALRLIGGARYTIEQKATTIYECLGSPLAPLVAQPACLPAPSQTLTATSPGSNPVVNSSTSFYSANWKAGLQYDVMPKSMVYFTASTGFKSGGFFAAPANINRYLPETLTAYELGSKNRFLNDRLQINLELFKWDYHNHQESHLIFGAPGEVYFGTLNSGDATIEGADLDVSAKLTSNDRVSGTFEFLHTRYDSFTYILPAFGPVASVSCPNVPNSQFAPNDTFKVNCAGKSLVRAPNFAANLSYQHDFDFDDGSTVTFNVDTQLSGSYSGAIEFTAGEYQRAFSMTNLGLTYFSPNGSWSASAYVNNVENSAAISGAFQDLFVGSVYYNSIRAPRTFGLKLQYQFDSPVTQPVASEPPPPAAPPLPAPAAAAPPAVETKRAFQVFFDFDKSEITDAAATIIAEAAAEAKSGNAVSLTVTGHTDTVGSNAYNQALSVRRAEAVKAKLVEDGVKADDIAALGVGKTGLLVPTGDGVREPQNRRVEIKLS